MTLNRKYLDWKFIAAVLIIIIGSGTIIAACPLPILFEFMCIIFAFSAGTLFVVSVLFVASVLFS